MTNILKLEGEFITLGKFLKEINVISSGGMAKWYLQENEIIVNHEVETRRGRKLYDGMTVIVPEMGSYLIQQQSPCKHGEENP